MKHQSETERVEKIVLAEIDRCRRRYESAQVYYAYGSRSARRTMDKYSALEKALEFYLENRAASDARMEKLLQIGEAMNRAEQQIELHGEKSLPARRIIEEVRRIIEGAPRERD